MNHPVVNISYKDAIAYARWAGAAVPFTTQFTVAAGRWDDGRLYPWGPAPEAGACHNAASALKDLVDVGQYQNGASLYGCYDMAGNAAEWVEGWDLKRDAAVSRVTGGSYLDPVESCQLFMESDRDPDSWDPSTGFRCAIKAETRSTQ
jgi:formylglycine-generating enzyme required for sulfatase activity